MNRDEINGIVLAGGKSRRMGGEDKAFSLIQGQPLITYVIDRLQPQLSTLVISANRNHHQYSRFGYPVVSDNEPDFPGPLAGIASGIEQTSAPLVLITPCDTPLLPTDLVERLYNTLSHSDTAVAVAHDGSRLQHLCFLAERGILPSIQQRLQQKLPRVGDWIESQSPAICRFDDPLAFTNINTPQERQQIEQVLAA